MSAQYSEGSGAGVAAGDYSELDGYDRALPNPPTSELTYIPSPDELRYLNMSRLSNSHLPAYIPQNYDTLERSGDFVSVPVRNFYPREARNTGFQHRVPLREERVRRELPPMRRALRDNMVVNIDVREATRRIPRRREGYMESANYMRE